LDNVPFSLYAKRNADSCAGFQFNPIFASTEYFPAPVA